MVGNDGYTQYGDAMENSLIQKNVKVHQENKCKTQKEQQKLA